MNSKLWFCFLVILAGCVPQEDLSLTNRSIGVIGCSNTAQTVYGYRWAGGEKMWIITEDTLHSYDGGAVRDWADDNSKLWDVFDTHFLRNPTTSIVWWQLCIRQDEVARSYEDAEQVLDILRQRIPGVRIYVSPLADYTGTVCEITGREGLEQAKSLALELADRNEDVFSGPFLGPLEPSQIMEQEDHCHPNEEGMGLMGKQLKDFFDREVLPANDSNLAQLENPVGQRNQQDYTQEAGISQEIQDFLRAGSSDKRITAAFQPVACQQSPQRKWDASYYQGKLIDTHLHIASIPDDPEDTFDDAPFPVLGVNLNVDDYLCMLTYEGTAKAFVFFPVWDPIRDESIEIVRKAREENSEMIVSFIMPPDDDGSPDGFPTVDAETLQEMLATEPGLFKGYGEIGLYARGDHGGPQGAPALPPDSERLQKIYPVLKEHNLVVYFHLGEGQQESFERVLEAHPDITFIWHGDQLIPYENGVQNLEHIAEILEGHPNVYYGIDELYGDVWLLRPEVTKEEFIAHFKDYAPLLKKDLATWKEFIEEHPDQVIWGSDRGVASVWTIDKDVALVLNDYVRYFIGHLSPDVQEKFAYLNAERALGR